jgi:hypothetical protein
MGIPIWEAAVSAPIIKFLLTPLGIKFFESKVLSEELR